MIVKGKLRSGEEAHTPELGPAPSRGAKVTDGVEEREDSTVEGQVLLFCQRPALTQEWMLNAAHRSGQAAPMRNLRESGSV